MAEYAVAIEKDTLFQGQLERFSNVYTFDTGVTESFEDLPIITRLVEIEKAVFGTAVNFRLGRSYGIAGPSIGNVMREVVDLTGTGTQTGPTVYRECAVCVTFDLPRSLILRRRRIGRKWLHVVNTPSTAAISTGGRDGSQAMDLGALNFYRTNYGEPLVNEAWPGGAEFASSGDPFANAQVVEFLEHRQFHRG